MKGMIGGVFILKGKLSTEVLGVERLILMRLRDFHHSSEEVSPR
jgi:hypothetical protein